MNNTPRQTEIGSRSRPMVWLFRRSTLTLAGLAMLLLSGCDYSFLTRSAVLAAWSPDGSQLAVCINNSDTNAAELWLVEPATGTKRRILSAERTRGLPHLLAPRWSVDGRRLYCLRTTEGEKDEHRPATIIGIDPANGDQREISVINYTGSRASHFSDTDILVPLADGTLAAQDLHHDGLYRLLHIDPVTGISSPFAPFSPLSGSWMVVSGSPDGTQLAVALPGPGDTGTTVDVRLSTGEQLYGPVDFTCSGEDQDSQPSLTWSPDSKRLALIVEGQPISPTIPEIPPSAHRLPEEDSDITNTLILVETESSVARIIGRDAFGMPPVFSPDGAHLAWSAGAGVRDAKDELMLEARVTRVADGTSIIASLPGMVFPLAWSTDGTRVVCFHGTFDDSDNPGSLHTVKADGTGTVVLSRYQQDRLSVAPSVGGRLAFVSGDGAVQVLDPGTGRLLFNDGLTTSGTIQAGEDHLLQGRPEAALATCSELNDTLLDGEQAANLAAISYAALRALQRSGEARDLLARAGTELANTEEPDMAFLVLAGSLSDLGFRPEAELLVEEQLLTRYPDSPHAAEALWGLAALKQSEGDGPASLRHLERLLRSYPEQRTEIGRALLLAALAENGENPLLVIELSGMIIEANSDMSDTDHSAPRQVAHYARGVALEQDGSSQQAREAYATAVAQNSDTHLADGRQVADLSWEALLRLARDETTAARR